MGLVAQHYGYMRKYRLIVRISWGESWLERVKNFKEALIALGFMCCDSEDVLCLENQEQVDSVYRLAAQYGLVIILIVYHE